MREQNISQYKYFFFSRSLECPFITIYFSRFPQNFKVRYLISTVIGYTVLEACNLSGHIHWIKHPYSFYLTVCRISQFVSHTRLDTSHTHEIRILNWCAFNRCAPLFLEPDYFSSPELLFHTTPRSCPFTQVRPSLQLRRSACTTPWMLTWFSLTWSTLLLLFSSSPSRKVHAQNNHQEWLLWTVPARMQVCTVDIIITVTCVLDDLESYKFLHSAIMHI